MHILVLATNESLYDLATQFAQIGCNVSYYSKMEKGLTVVDDKEVVHVSSWRPHAESAHLVLTNDVSLYYAYEASGGKAPILYQANRYSENILMPPHARDLLVYAVTGGHTEVRTRPWWKIWGRKDA